ncbi:ABC transporter permease [Rubrobacter aplysinae]|uniref:ABC transporter permease n=1 Tax=Rubrobacter aplysinae TaxID=909625 RepID=UPI00064BBEA2|nr:ABC transporter permease [Rubrobacter aplysinae]
MSNTSSMSSTSSASGQSREKGGIGQFFSIAGAVGWRGTRTYLTRPSLLIPSLIFPIFLFAAFTGALSKISEVPAFDFAAGYTAFIYVWLLLQSVALGGAFTGFSIARDFESGFAQRLMLAAPRHGGILLGYMLYAVVRAVITATVVTIVALLGGMQVLGAAGDLIGLYTLALIVNAGATLFAAGMAFRLRSSQGGFLIQTPIFVLLFLAPVFVPQNLLEGAVGFLSTYNPITYVVEAGRGLISADPTGVPAAFIAAAILVVLFLPWAITGLRRAAKAGG